MRSHFSVRQHLCAVAIFLATTLLFFSPLLEGETFTSVETRQRQVYPWASGTRPSDTVEALRGTPVAGDWNCDGVDEIGAWTAGRFSLPSSPQGRPVELMFGAEGDTPLAGDWDGNGCDEVGVRRRDIFAFRDLLTSGPADVILGFGAATDRPLVGDWNGDGADGIAVRRAGIFYLRNSITPGPVQRSFRFGAPDEPAVAGDWGGDGRDEVAVRTAHGFRLLSFLPGRVASGFVPFSADAGPLPLAGDWNGDGVDDLAASDGARISRFELPDGEEVTHIDQAETFYPWQVFMSRAARSGQVPLWNPYSFAGAPFLANGQNGALYPPRVGLSLVAPPERVHDLLVASHMFLGGLTMFLLLAYFATSYPAALIGGLAWMVNSFMLVWLALEHFVVIEAWLPLAVLLIDIAVRRRSWPASLALALVLALLFLGANFLFAELTFLIVALYGLSVFVREQRARRRARGPDPRALVRDVLQLAAPWLLAGCLVAVVLVPTLELAASSGRSSLSYELIREFRLPPSALLNIFRPPPDHDIYDALLFLGTPTALLALIGCFRRHPVANFMRWQALLVLLFVLGTPIAWLAYNVLPGFDSFKPLGRAAFAFAFPAAILAAFGFDVLADRLRRLAPSRARGKAILAVALPALVAAAIVVQMRGLAAGWMVHQPADRQALYPETPLVAQLRREADTLVLPAELAFAGSASMVFPLRSALGYESLLPSRTENLWRVVEGIDPDELDRKPLVYAYRPTASLASLRADLLARLGVTHVVTPPDPASGPEPLLAAGLRLAYSAEDGRIYQVPDAMPPAYLVPSCETAETPEAALGRVLAPAFDPRRAVVLEADYLQGAGLSCSEAGSPDRHAGSAAVVGRDLNSLSVDVEAAGRSWLVVGEMWDRGWKATVDGDSAAVLPGNYAFRAVAVPAGSHVVSLRYEPPGYAVGKLVSLGTLAMTLGLLALVLVRGRARALRPVAPREAVTP